MRREYLKQFCRKGKSHMVGNWMWGLETISGLRGCKHNNLGEEKQFLTICPDCNVHLTKSLVCILKDLKLLDKEQLKNLEKTIYCF